jgi:hypothetical protein
MSWSQVKNCWNCKRAGECPDSKEFDDAVSRIHQNPEHGQKGGSGTVSVVCYKYEPKAN